MDDAELTSRVIAASGPPAVDDLATFLRKRLTAARENADPVDMADLDSKLRIIGLCETETPETGGLSLARRVLRNLGAPYATHPDYKENWRP